MEAPCVAACLLLLLALCGQMMTTEAGAMCQQPQVTGMCRGYFRKFFFNSNTGACEQFIYGGCGGNDNRFDTIDQCRAACGGEDVCQLPKQPGMCYAYMPRFFHNATTGQCEQFVYGGCGGNGNRFNTAEECQAACGKKNVCQLPKKPGMCLAYMPRFFFNAKTGKCEQFVYGGCGGNGNRFNTIGECQAACPQNN